MKERKVLIAESPWDSECYRKVFKKEIRSIYIYDFKKIGRRSIVYRALRFIYIATLFFYYVFKGYKIIISDLNREGLTLLNSKIKNVYAFIPNLLVRGDNNPRYVFRNKVLDNLVAQGNIYFSDNVTSSLFLADDKKVPAPFELDESSAFKCGVDFLVLIILPASISHNQTKNTASRTYQYLREIGMELIKSGFNVKFKPHPRDWALYKEVVMSKIPEKHVCHEGSYNKYIVYISYFSSVNLNKIYGKGFGFWLCDDVSMAIDDGFEELIPFTIKSSKLKSILMECRDRLLLLIYARNRWFLSG